MSWVANHAACLGAREETWELYWELHGNLATVVHEEGNYFPILKLMCWLGKALSRDVCWKAASVCGKGKLCHNRSPENVVKRRIVTITTTLCKDVRDNY